MGTPPSFPASLLDTHSPISGNPADWYPKPLVNDQGASAVETATARLQARIEDLERTRLVDAARIAVLEAEVRKLASVLRGMVDQTDPSDRVGVALTGLASEPER